MRLLKPEPGELVDRQTILELKIDHANVDIEDEKKTGLPELEQARGGSKLLKNRTVVNKGAIGTKVHLFFDELELISNKLIEAWIPDLRTQDQVDKYDIFYAELSEVNSKLWDLEDEARILRDAPDKFQQQAAVKAAEVLFNITALNDRRAELVKSINALWGIQSQEKSY